MSERWLRLYEGVVNDPKMQRLPAETFRGLINLWCIASANAGTLPSVDDMAFTLRMTEAKVEALLETLKAADLLDEDETGIRPHNWNGRQYKSDVSTARVKRHRERRKAVTSSVDETLHETPPETETETETEKIDIAPSEPSGAFLVEKRATEKLELTLTSEDDLELPASLDRRPYPEAFQALWNAYRPIASPNATKADAHKAWEKLRTPERDAAFEGLKRYVAWLGKERKRRPDHPVKHLATFINKRGWEPFLERTNGAAAGGRPPKDEHEAELRMKIGRERQAWPSDEWGPAPNTPGCLIPSHLIGPTDGVGWREWEGDA